MTRSLLKVRVYRLSHRRYSIRAILRVIYRFLADSLEARGGGKSVFVVRRSRQDFFFGENHERLSFWRESNASNNLKESQRYWRCLGELGERRDT